MCGRYIANSEDEITEIREILRLISLRIATDVDVFPTNNALIIDKNTTPVLAKWGLPKWDNKGVIINAKSETYEQSGFFKPFAANRCIVPAHGYYEWQTLPDKTKVKYVFTSKDKHGIFMAGIYNKDGNFAIITKPAADEIAFIHSRMPMIIEDNFINKFASFKASEGSAEVELVDNLSVVSGNKFKKYKGDAFSNKELCAALKAAGITDIEIVGVDGGGCVALTALGAIREGFNVTINTGSVGTTFVKQAVKFNAKLRKKGARFI